MSSGQLIRNVANLLGIDKCTWLSEQRNDWPGRMIGKCAMKYQRGEKCRRNGSKNDHKKQC